MDQPVNMRVSAPIPAAERIIDEAAIESALRLEPEERDAARVRDILQKALALQGLNMHEVAVLTAVDDPALLHEIFETARKVKEEIYGPRLVLFAPLYVSNLCKNECLYCAFRVRNTAVRRRALTQEEIAEETRIIINQGHKRCLLVSGEAYPNEGFSYILKAIETIYATRTDQGEIRRINVNIAPLSVDEFRQLKAAHIGTYQIFQETYHRPTYGKVHVWGQKADYDWRITAMDRAMEAGIDDVGVGVLFGLYDWRWDLLAMMQHCAHLERKFGVGPHTVSVPRIEPATNSEFTESPPHAVPDEDFRKLVAILRIAVPYTGMILSTRERPEIRKSTFALGVSQISAGSRTNPGGYHDGELGEDIDAAGDSSQFSLGDHRSVDEVVRDIAELGYIPSFCTACYRLGRTGADFMDLAKPGLIKFHCDPNALSTFVEYVEDYASPETRAVAERKIAEILEKMTPKQRKVAQRLVDKVRVGDRDVFV